jgi:O-antigen/teichoic acid export membrane protein
MEDRLNTKQTVARNVLWNWAGMATNMIAGFVVAPFLVHRLGHTVYGLWILVASLLYYFALLDMGVRAAVGRQIAFYRAKGDYVGLNATMNAAITILCVAGVVALLGTLGVMSFFFHLFQVEPQHVAEVRWSLLLMGITLVLWLPLNMFDAMLWAYQRFDLINMIDISSALSRVALTFYFIGHGHGLVVLALINLLTLAAGQAMKAVAILHMDPLLRLGFRYVKRDITRAMLGVGFWNFFLSMATVVNGQVGSAIIGSRLSVMLVTPFSIAARLLGYGRDFVEASTGVLTPVCIGLHASQRHDQQQALFLECSKYSMALALMFLTVFLVLGKAVIRLWMGPDLTYSAGLLMIMAVGEALPMAQWVAYSVIMGKYHHRELAIMSVIEDVTVITLGLVLVGRYGLTGVAVGFAISGFLCRGIFRLIYACRLVHVPLWRYFAHVALPVAAVAAVPTLVLWALADWKPPHSWHELFIELSIYGVTFALCGIWMVADRLAGFAPEGSLARRFFTAIHSLG